MNLLVKKAKRGDTEAFIALVEECRMTLKRVAIGYLGNEEDAADAIQDTILTAYEHIGKLKKDEYFKTWMVRILINHCTKIYRIHKKNAAWEREYEAESCDSGTADVEFRELLLALPEDSRMIFQLYYGEQFTTREIADILHVKENTVKSRLHRGKEQLREQLK
jgi:RNA polymerase sigma-70 factor (ECF subfamily)